MNASSIPGTDLRPNDGVETPPFWESEGLAGLLASSDLPFFVYDMRLVERRILRLRQRLGPDFQLYYAVKANPNPEILKLLAGWADGADVSSARELELSLESGFDPASISFAGPGKTDGELHAAVRQGIGSISIESLNELHRVERVAVELNAQANVSLRVNPVRVVREFAIKMGGKSSQFGIDEERAGDFFKALSECPHCRFAGIHVYSGTQCLDADALAGNFKNTLELVRTAVHEFGAKPSFVNFGGGFGIPYHEGQSPLDEASVCHSLRGAFSDFPKSLGRPDLTGILELGRYLIAEAGIYAARIVDMKTSRGRTFCVLEGGMNHHLPASGHFGQVIRKNFIIRSLSKPDSAPREEVTLVGPLCTSIDLMGDRVLLAKPEIGDWIGFLNSGAYAFTASPLLFLSHDSPREMLVDADGTIRIARDSVFIG
jgi:diaminopimelate decarboxylase